MLLFRRQSPPSLNVTRPLCLIHYLRFSLPHHCPFTPPLPCALWLQMESFPEHCIIALNSEGLHFLNEANETLSTYGYADIYRWGGSSTQFSIIIWNPDTQVRP